MKVIILKMFPCCKANRRSSINQASSLHGSLLIAVLIAFFGLISAVHGVVPAPDGCYPGYTTAEGCNTLQSLTTGRGNTGVGWYSLFSSTDASFNTGIGGGALALNNGDSNTAVGAAALLLNNTGTENTAVGTDAMVHNDTGSENTALGTGALFFNVDSNSNTAVGYSALIENDMTGSGLANFNTAVGAQALENNSDGESNTAVGFQALNANTTGITNVAIGGNALAGNTTGSANTGVGSGALVNSTTAVFNTALGAGAGFSNAGGNSNTAVGTGALTNNNTGSDNTALGRSAGYAITGSGNVSIGEGVLGIAGENNTTRIRNIYNTIQPVVGTDPDEVTINSGNRLGRANVSSRRYKHDIQPMDKASEVIYALKPVSFRYKKEYDATQTVAFGVIAEDVAEVCPDLVGRNPEGQPESVRYKQINAMLLNEFLKEHGKVQKLESAVVNLTAMLKEQAAQIQKVSAQLELNSHAARKVVIDR